MPRFSNVNSEAFSNVGSEAFTSFGNGNLLSFDSVAAAGFGAVSAPAVAAPASAAPPEPFGTVKSPEAQPSLAEGDGAAVKPEAPRCDPTTETRASSDDEKPHAKIKKSRMKIKLEAVRSQPWRSARRGYKEGFYHETNLINLMWKGTGTAKDPIRFDD